jgi:hypothetical protein
MHAQESNKIFRPFFMCEGSVYADEEALLLCPHWSEHIDSLYCCCLLHKLGKDKKNHAPSLMIAPSNYKVYNDPSYLA